MRSINLTHTAADYNTLENKIYMFSIKSPLLRWYKRAISQNAGGLSDLNLRHVTLQYSAYVPPTVVNTISVTGRAALQNCLLLTGGGKKKSRPFRK